MTLMCFCEGDDHSIMIYYPSSAGGGMKELFRKVSDFIDSSCLACVDSKPLFLLCCICNGYRWFLKSK